jgi:hypothetical protein
MSTDEEQIMKKRMRRRTWRTRTPGQQQLYWRRCYESTNVSFNTFQNTTEKHSQQKIESGASTDAGFEVGSKTTMTCYEENDNMLITARLRHVEN